MSLLYLLRSFIVYLFSHIVSIISLLVSFPSKVLGQEIAMNKLDRLTHAEIHSCTTYSRTQPTPPPYVLMALSHVFSPFQIAAQLCSIQGRSKLTQHGQCKQAASLYGLPKVSKTSHNISHRSPHSHHSIYRNILTG